MWTWARRGWKDERVRRVVWAVVWATGWCLALKALTGRTPPEAEFPVDLLARSMEFSFGFMRGGVIEGWPSGHAMSNVAMAVAVWRTESDPRARFAAAFWGVWVFLAVVFGIHGDVHWLSDGVAGATLGVFVGWVCARG